MNYGNGIRAKLLKDGAESHHATVTDSGWAHSLYDPPVNRYRVTYTLLGLALAVVAIGTVIFAPSGALTEVPETLESYSPADGATVLHQIQVEIDLPVNYQIVLVVDGVTIPADEIGVIAQTGKFTWRPTDTTIIPDWSVGLHTVWVRWDRTVGLPDPGEWIWTFRVQ